jgi:hypothetical protein
MQWHLVASVVGSLIVLLRMASPVDTQFATRRPDFLLDLDLAAAVAAAASSRADTPAVSSLSSSFSAASAWLPADSRWSRISVVHPVFAAATPMILDTWAALKSTAVAGRSAGNNSPRLSLRDLADRAAARNQRGGGASAARRSSNEKCAHTSDGEEYLLDGVLCNITLALQGVASYATAGSASTSSRSSGKAGDGDALVFFTDDVLGDIARDRDVLVSKRPGAPQSVPCLSFEIKSLQALVSLCAPLLAFDRPPSKEVPCFHDTLPCASNVFAPTPTAPPASTACTRRSVRPAAPALAGRSGRRAASRPAPPRRVDVVVIVDFVILAVVVVAVAAAAVPGALPSRPRGPQRVFGRGRTDECWECR